MAAWAADHSSDSEKNKTGSSRSKRRWLASLSALSLLAATTPPTWAATTEPSSPIFTSASVAASSPAENASESAAPSESTSQTVRPPASVLPSAVRTESTTATATEECSSPGATASVSVSAAETTERASSGNEGTLGDRVWFDENRDGIQNDREPGVASVQKTLHSESGEQLATTATDAQGTYLFEGD